VLAGPQFGVVAIAVTVVLAGAFDSRLVQSWAVIGAAINLFNLLPIPGLDGGTILRSVRRKRRGRAALLVSWIGTAFATHVLLVMASELFSA
jgi:Zn-dependent protease